mgnify:CR=1 FL=1
MFNDVWVRLMGLFLVSILSGCSLIQRGSFHRAPPPEEVCNKDIKYQISAKYKDQVSQCFEQLMSRNPQAQGTVDLELVVVYGTVVDVRFQQSSTLKGKKLKSCIRQRALKWTFSDQCEDLFVQQSFPLMLDDEN